MRRSVGLIALAVVVAGFVPGTAPAAPATAAIKCAVSSPSNIQASCTYKSSQSDRQVLTVVTAGSYTIDWVEGGNHFSYACTAGTCRVEPGRAFRADKGTTVRITVTKGVVVVREVNIGRFSV